MYHFLVPMKNLKINELEILSPAGSPEGFLSAINAGADAVYLGLSNFNARMKAENFNTENIREYIKIAHTFGVKVYVTINTLLNDSDFDELIELVKTLTEAKADAFIVQDLGVFYVLSKCFKNIVIHTSTQMGVHNTLGASIAKQLGASRVVLSRETKLEDIKQIKSQTGLEIEHFVQGALCVAFSGNCYLSALEKNMSGNEGKCLQLCRLPYFVNGDNTEKYFLSARDLCLFDSLEELVDAGVSSFKIEGRLRHSGYVATATSAYKTALTSLFKEPLLAAEKNQIKNALRVSFSRGEFNRRAYLDDETPDRVINTVYQNHIGIKIGTVTKVEPFKNGLFKITAKLSHEIGSGDGLKIIDSKNQKQVASLGVGNVERTKTGEYVFFTKNKFSAGLDVHLTQNAKTENELLNQKRKIKIDFKIKAFAGKPFEIVAKANGTGCVVSSDYVLEEAKSVPLYSEDIKAQFEKLSDTLFEAGKFAVETDWVFLPKSELNKLRRLTIQTLQNALILANEKHLNVEFDESKYYAIKSQKTLSNPKNIVIFDEKSKKIAKNDSIFIYSPSVFAAEDITQKSKEFGENFGLYLPTILNHNDSKILTKILEKNPNIWLYANNIYGLSFAGSGFKIIASPLMNIKNSFAVKCLNSLGVTTISASIEADDNFIENNNLISFESGAFPVMTFAHCPHKTINQNTCKNCAYKPNLSLSSKDGKSYKITRTKLENCQFEMNKKLERQAKFSIKNLKV